MNRLSDYEGLAGLKVVRDGPFATTGKLTTPLDDLCVPLRAQAYVGEVNQNSRVTAVITTEALAEALDERLALAVASDPDAAHSEIHARLAEAHAKRMRAQPNQIDPSAHIDPAAWIEDHGVSIGAGAWLGPHVRISSGTTIGAGCVIHSGTALGVPGFNVGVIDGRQRIVPQLGGVRLGRDIEMLANCSVARAVFGGDTVMGDETVTDSLVYVAHDVQIGRKVQICAMANILGRTIVGDGAYIGPAAVIKNGLVLGPRARVSIGSVVTQNVAEGATVSGNFAVPHDRFLHHIKSIR